MFLAMMTRLRNPAILSKPPDAHALTATLMWLRPCAALGQVLAIAVAVSWLHIALPLVPLAAGIIVLALAAPVTLWRLRREWPVSGIEAACHVSFDLLLLGWALYFTGGASNPFITLLLIPVALAAAALSVRSIGFVVTLAAGVYAVLMFYYIPLPDMVMHDGAGFRLHLTGMAVNFLIAVLLLAVFIGRMTALLHAQHEASRRLRERLLRNEGILAVATQAATAAHELNTPLSSLLTLLPELKRGRENDMALRDDVGLMVSEVKRCQQILRAMVEYGRRQLSGDTQTTTLGEYLRVNVERFRLLCPEAEISAHIAAPLNEYPIEVDPGLAQALLNLMRNAYDASSQNNSCRVTLQASASDGCVEFVIGDHGIGLPEGRLGNLPAPSSKPNGLGMGLALARATIERLRGELRAQPSATGTRICVRLPSQARTNP